MQDTIKQLKEYAKRNYGKRCKDFAPMCCVCELYRAIDMIEYLLIDEESTTK